MDLANMRQNGVRSIMIHCIDCGRSGVVNLDTYPGYSAVKSFERRMVCNCGSKRADIRPNIGALATAVAHHASLKRLDRRVAGIGVQVHDAAASAIDAMNH